MKFPIFASFIVFVAWLTYEISKSKEKNNKASKEFWEKENQANNVRKKSLDDLAYVRFPFDRLPSEEIFLNKGLLVPQCLKTLMTLKDKSMVNLSGITNTDLKLKYGTANITILSEYDENFELFCKNIYELAKFLDENGMTDDALFLLEEALKYGTDISGHYKLLARIYQRNNEKEKIISLKNQVEHLHSLTKNSILTFLDEILASMN